MKTGKLIMVALASVVSATAMAGHDDYAGKDGTSFSDWARVTRVTPQYERVNTPQRECYTEVQTTEHPVYGGGSGQRSPAGVIIGGITGGIVGNQVGKGRGRAAATAIGAVVGAVVGDRIDNDDVDQRRVEYYETRDREVKRCRMVDRWENRVSGYLVDYEYAGRSWSRLMSEDPGRRFKVRVSVEPE